MKEAIKVSEKEGIKRRRRAPMFAAMLCKAKNGKEAKATVDKLNRKAYNRTEKPYNYERYLRELHKSFENDDDFKRFKDGIETAFGKDPVRECGTTDT